MTNGKQNWMAERLDRSKEAPAAKAARSARTTQIRAEARADLRRNLARYLTPEERAAYLCDTLDMVAEHLHPILGRVEAMTAFNSRATDIGGPLKLNRAIATARAEQLFAKRPANEDHANDGEA